MAHQALGALAWLLPASLLVLEPLVPAFQPYWPFKSPVDHIPQHLRAVLFLSLPNPTGTQLRPSYLHSHLKCPLLQEALLRPLSSSAFLTQQTKRTIRALSLVNPWELSPLML